MIFYKFGRVFKNFGIRILKETYKRNFMDLNDCTVQTTWCKEWSKDKVTDGALSIISRILEEIPSIFRIIRSIAVAFLRIQSSI